MNDIGLRELKLIISRVHFNKYKLDWEYNERKIDYDFYNRWLEKWDNIETQAIESYISDMLKLTQTPIQ